MSSTIPDPNDPMSQAFLAMVSSPVVTEIYQVMSFDLPPDLEGAFQPIRVAFKQEGTGTPFDEVRERSSKNDLDYFYNLFGMGVVEGLGSSYYHLRQYVELEAYVQSKKPELAKLYVPGYGFGNTLSISTRKLTYEYEGFMLMSRATLDRLTWFFDYYFKNEARNLYRLETALLKSFKTHARAQRVAAAIDKHRAFLDTQIATDKNESRTNRDRLAHREYVGFGVLNIMFDSDGNVNVVVIPPSGTPEDHAGLVLIESFRQLQACVIDLLWAFFGVGVTG